MNRFKGTVFWAWNDEITKEGIDKKIQQMAQQGIGGFFIHSRTGIRVEYLSERFMDCVQYAVDAAKQYGLDVWLYDEDGWPSGSAGGVVAARGDAYCAKQLMFFTEKPSDEKNIIAEYKKENGQWKRVPSGGELFAYRDIDRDYVDLLNPDVTRAFIEETHEKYKKRFEQYFGNTICGIFTDEPQMKKGTPWSDCLEKEFQKEYGESLLDGLYQLYEFPSDQPNLFRYHYFTLIERMYAESYVGQLAAWCNRNNLLFTGHYPCEDGLCYQYEVAADVMHNYSYMTMPAIDHLGRRLTSTLLTTQLRSVKNQLDLPNVLSETFGCGGWNISWNQLAWIWGYQASKGVNTPCYHLSAYSTRGRRKRDYPAFYSEQEPWWECFQSFNTWAERINALDSQGESCADVLVINPIQNMGLYGFCSEGQARIASRYRLLLENLENCQIDYEIGDNFVLEQFGKAENGVLQVGRCRYTTVIVPDAESVEQATLDILNEYVQQGGTVVFTDAPPKSLNGVCSEKVDTFVQNACKNPKCAIVANRDGLWNKYFQAVQYQRKVCIQNRIDPSVVGGLSMNIRKGENWTQCHVMNKSRTDTRALMISFPGAGSCAKEEIDGTETFIATVQGERESFAEFDLKPMQSLVFRFYNNRFESVEETYLEEQRLLKANQVYVPKENALTVDSVRLFADGRDCGVYPTEKVNDAVYGIAREQGKSIDFRVEYRFNVQDGAVVRCIAAETDGFDGFSLNGIDLSDKKCGTYFDDSVIRYNVEGLCHNGVNVAVLTGTAQIHGSDQNFDNEYELHRFFYPNEVESIYVLGDFDVDIRGGLHRECGYCFTTETEFTIVKSTAKTVGDLTLQGMPFYRGWAEYSFSYYWDGNGFVSACGEWDASACRIYVNGKEQPNYLFAGEDASLNLSADSENQIVVRLYSSNRNLLGPHYHYLGEPSFVGVNTFTGDRGFEDFMVDPVPPQNTRVGKTAFVPFGMKNFYIKKCGGKTREK